MKFKTETLRELTWAAEYYGLSRVTDEIVGQRRWCTEHEMVFRDSKTDKLYRVFYDVGSTEMQDMRPFEDSGEYEECEEVEAYEVPITKYRKVGDSTASGGGTTVSDSEL